MLKWLLGLFKSNGQKGIVQIDEAVGEFEGWITKFKSGIENCMSQMVNNSETITRLNFENEKLQLRVDKANKCIQGITNLMEGV